MPYTSAAENIWNDTTWVDSGITWGPTVTVTSAASNNTVYWNCDTTASVTATNPGFYIYSGDGTLTARPQGQLYDTTGNLINERCTIYTTAAGGVWTIVTDAGGTISVGGASRESARNALRRFIKSNLLIKVRDPRGAFLGAKVDPRELKARDTLRDMLSEAEWRRYVTNGFVMVKGVSGRFYQVFNDQRRIQVYHRGKAMASICIHTDRSCPPTDHVINMKVLIETDEELVWKEGNVSNLQSAVSYKNYLGASPRSENLASMAKRIKEQAIQGSLGGQIWDASVPIIAA